MGPLSDRICACSGSENSGQSGQAAPSCFVVGNRQLRYQQWTVLRTKFACLAAHHDSNNQEARRSGTTETCSRRTSCSAHHASSSVLAPGFQEISTAVGWKCHSLQNLHTHKGRNPQPRISVLPWCKLVFECAHNSSLIT